MAKGKSRKGGSRRSRAKKAVSRVAGGRWSRWLIFGAGLAATYAVGEGIAAVTKTEPGWKKGLIFAGTGLGIAAVARMAGARRLSMPLQTAGVGLAVMAALHKQVDQVAGKTAETLSGVASYPSGRMMDAQVVNAPSAPQTVSYKPAKPSTIETVASMAPALAQAAANIAAAFRQPAPAATAGIDDWDVEGANGIDDWAPQGAGYLTSREYEMVGNR
jgi:hypothetical protein